ncbi:MAG: hypothetical protein H7Y37_03840 [Anaerolineae bacterium]|nr:hypothetical protein [Gloeobacterales cyanobacterium ES-bin-313]
MQKNIAHQFLILLCLLIVVGCGDQGHPKDDQMLAQFAKHRLELEQLIRMFKTDKGLGRVGSGFTRPDNPTIIGVSAERIEKYRQLCSVVGAVNCIEGYDATYDRLYGSVSEGITEEKVPIWIHISARGLSISGSGKGFFYSEMPPKSPFKLVKDLDRISITRPAGTWLRHIEGPWYLYFDAI